jgi:hypothetical protein
MEKSTRICFQTTSEISNILDSIAENEKLSVSEVVNSIINEYLKGDKNSQGIKQNHRRFKRKKVALPAYIGDPRWQRSDFEAITILDVSIIFRLPDNHWPINVQISPQRVLESTKEVQVGAALVNPDFHAYSALQKYLM